MSDRPATAPVVIDAGPALSFFSTNQERLLLSAVGGYLQAPDTVLDEIQRRSLDPRFKAARTVTRKLLAAGRITQLSDDVTPELSRVCSRLTGLPLPQRLQQGKDLGELMVIAHAVVQAEHGRHVIVLIDDGDGQRLAALETARLDRLRPSRPNLGTLSLTHTSGSSRQHADRHSYRIARRCRRYMQHSLPATTDSGRSRIPASSTRSSGPERPVASSWQNSVAGSNSASNRSISRGSWCSPPDQQQTS